MKKEILKFLAGTAAVATLTGGMAFSVQAAPEKVTDTTLMNADYYETLNGKNGEGLRGTPSLTIAKYKNDKESSPGIKGVKFKYAKVGDLYQIADGNKVSMTYGVNATFAETFRINDAADYYSGTGAAKIYYYKDIAAINSRYLQDLDIQTETTTLRSYIDSFDDISTGENGTVEVPTEGYGLYVLVEWDASNASVKEDGKDKKISITNVQSPFLVALPTSSGTGDGAFWENQVTARIKNSSTEPETEKKIVTANETETNGNETVDDTDITSIGDMVHFRLKGTLPKVPEVKNGKVQKINKYILVDNLSKGLTPVTETGSNQLKDVSVRTTNDNSCSLTAEDYTTAVTDYDASSADAQAEYTGGRTITVTFTESGLAKLSKWAADTNDTADKEIYFYYTAEVNEDAEIGPNTQTSAPVGNPNEVKLQYRIGTSADMETEWDKVTEYTFGIKATKMLAGNAGDVTENNKNKITFALYSEGEGKGGTKEKIYYEVEKDKDHNEADATGAYHVTGETNTESKVTDKTKIEMHPAAGGVLNIRGLEEGTYFLEELRTVSGYNLLKAPVKIEITAGKSESINAYVGTNNQYTGTLDQEKDDDGWFEVAINNIKGFQMPSTGGRGIWIFVLAGVLVVAAGCGYYSLTIRKNRAK